MAWGEIVSVYIYRLINNCHSGHWNTGFIPISRDLEMCRDLRTFHENFSLHLVFVPVDVLA